RGERQHARRRQQLEAIRQRMEPTPEPDEDLPKAVVGANELRLHAEPSAQRERPWLLGQERIGAGLHEEAIDALRHDGAPEPLARLDHLEVEVDAALARE